MGAAKILRTTGALLGELVSLLQTRHLLLEIVGFPDPTQLLLRTAWLLLPIIGCCIIPAISLSTFKLMSITTTIKQSLAAPYRIPNHFSLPLYLLAFD
jgi:hypothetical protein